MGAQPPTLKSFAQIKPVRKTKPVKIKLAAKNKSQFSSMETNIKPSVADPAAFRYHIKTNYHGKDYMHNSETYGGLRNNCNEKSTIPSSAQNDSMRVGFTLRVFQKKKKYKRTR